MTDPNTNKQAQLFLYDLGNTAKEHWFKPDEQWEVGVVTHAEKTAIEKKYHPTVSAEFPAETLVEMLGTVKGGLKQAKSSTEQLLDTKTIRLNNLNYLVAYNPKRQRT